MTPPFLDRFRRLFPLPGEERPLLDDLARHGRLVTLAAGTHICLEGGECDRFAFLLAGSARVYKVGENGREITLYRIGPGECCILTLSSILAGRRFPAFAVAETEVEALVVPATLLHGWSDRLPGWRRYSWELVSGRLADIISLVEEITFRRMDERLLDLLRRSDRFPPGRRVEITHRQIAIELGTSREVVSRLLKELEQQGRIRQGRGWLCVTPPAV